MTAIQINMSPGDIAKEYDVPALDWEIANKRACVVLDTSRAPQIQTKLKALSNYAQVVSVCQTWKASTFDDLVTFSQTLAAFSQTDMQSYLKVLGMILEALTGGDTSMKARLDHTVEGMVSDASDLAQQAQALSPVLKDFDDQMSLTSVGSGSDPTWSSFSIQAGMGFNFIGGRFNLIVQDLQNLQSTVEKQIAKDMPFVAKIVDLPDAQRQWDEVGNLAQGFVTNAPAQRKYLDGDW